MRSAAAGLVLSIATLTAPASAGSTDDHKALMIAGQVMRNNGRLLRAREMLATCASDACADADQDCEGVRAYCKGKLAEVEPEIPSLAIHVEDDRGLPVRDAAVLVDTLPVDVALPVDVDPGRHLVRATYAGRTATTEVDAARDAKARAVRVRIDLRREVTQRPVPWYVAGFGVLAGVATLTAVGFAAAAQAQASNLAYCNPTCDPKYQGLFTATTVTVDVALGVAVASALAATFAYLLRPSHKHTVHVEQQVVGGQ
jgi:hypothetical protein